MLKTKSDNCYYLDNINKYPSVTNIIDALRDKTFINAWRDRTPNADQITQISADNGKSFHKLIELYSTGYEDKLSIFGTYVSNCMFKSVKPYLNKYIKNIVAVETKLVSDIYKICGVFDCLALDHDNKLIVIDYKNSLKIKNLDYILEYKQQIGCYILMIREKLKVDVSRGLILITNRENYKTQELELDIEECVKEAIVLINNYYKLQGDI